MSTLTAALSILALSIGGMLIAERLRFRRFWARGCTGKAWKERFPSASKAEIRAFLSMFVRASGFRTSRMLSFTPSDRVTDIYRTRCPSNWPDMTELETLVAEARRRYGIDLTPVWHDGITLGEVFEKARAA